MRERRNMSQPWGNINMFNDNNKKQWEQTFWNFTDVSLLLIIIILLLLFCFIFSHSAEE